MCVCVRREISSIKFIERIDLSPIFAIVREMIDTRGEESLSIDNARELQQHFQFDVSRK